MQSTAAPDEARTLPPDGRPGRAAMAVCAAVLLGGIAERWILYIRTGRTDSDEALSGLMARQLQHGHYSLFLWGQHYGGTLEVLPIAVVTRVLGPSLLAERLTTLVLSALCAVLGGILGDRLAGRWAGVSVAAVLWLWPAYFVEWSSQEYLYYVPVVALSLGAAVLAVRSARRPGDDGPPLALGVLLGLAWWTSPNMTVFVPLVVGLGLRAGGHRIRRSVVAALGSLLGAAPWVAYNIRHPLASLHATGANGTYHQRLSELVHVGVPLALGLRRTDTGWIAPWAHSVYLLCLLVAAVVAARTVALWIAHRLPFPADILAVAAYPFIYAASPVGSTPTSVFIPRYFFFAWPLVALFVGRLVGAVSGGDLRTPGRQVGTHASTHVRATRRRAVITATLVGVGTVALTGAALDQATSIVPQFIPPAGLTAAQDNLHVTAAGLERHGVSRVFTNYWTAYELDQVAGPRIIATPAWDGPARYLPWDREVRSSRDPAWVLAAGSPREAALVSWLRTRRISYRAFTAAGFQVIVPDGRVLPEDVPVAVLTNLGDG